MFFLRGGGGCSHVWLCMFQVCNIRIFREKIMNVFFLIFLFLVYFFFIFFLFLFPFPFFFEGEGGDGGVCCLQFKSGLN